MVQGLLQALESRLLFSKVIYVDNQSPVVGPAQDGISWATAFVDLQPALEQAATGDQIHMADGLYAAADSANPYRLKSDIQVLGGYAGAGSPDPDQRDPVNHPTQLTGQATATQGALNATEVDDAVLDGLTIFGGLLNDHASITCVDCLFRGASLSAVRNRNGSAASFTRCTFNNNSSTYGGAIYSRDSSLRVQDSTFTNNDCSNRAAAIYGSGLVSLLHCRFTRNVSRRFSGGAVELEGATSAMVRDCVFEGNKAFDNGGALIAGPETTAINCTFVGNSAGVGGAVDGSPALINCTLVGNTAGYAGAAISSYGGGAVVTNCILRANHAYVHEEIYEGATVSFSDIEGGYDGQANIDAEAHFVREPNAGPDAMWGTEDDDYGDLRLTTDSPCIDAGSNAALPADITTDLAGDPRVVDYPGVHDPDGAIVDMGAIELPSPLPLSGGQFLIDSPKPSVKIGFNFDVAPGSLTAGDLKLINQTNAQTIDCDAAASLVYDVTTRTATWSFPQLLSDGRYRATLDAGSVSDTAGHPLASGYSFDFFVLAGDANRDRRVNVSDLGILATNWQAAGEFTTGDFNYDGRIDALDLGILATNWQKNLAAPAAPFALSGPTSSPGKRTSSHPSLAVELIK